MTKITFVHPKNRIESVDADDDTSVMHEAVRHGIRGIVAECGGNAICATCHVYVDESWFAKLEPVSEDEDLTLDEVAARRLPNSRLCCQIRITPQLNGLTLRLPERQT
jgi:2Fe-2S ferredoxin